MTSAVAFLMLCLAMVACTAQPRSPEALIFATDPTYAPFEFTRNGVLTGFDIDLITTIGKATGTKVSFESVPLGGIVPALKAGTYDGAVAAMVATRARADSIAFSRPYFETGLVILVRADNTSIHGIADLKGKTIAVEIGSNGAQKAATIPGANVRTFDGAPSALLEVANGSAVAAIGDGASSKFAVATGAIRGIRIVPGQISSDFYVIGLPKNSKNIDLVNAGLAKLVRSGEYARIYKKWFNENPPQSRLFGGYKLNDAIAASRGDTDAFAFWKSLKPLLDHLAIMLNSLPILISGAGLTIVLATLSYLISVVIGTIIAVGRFSNLKVCKFFCAAYTDFFRGTPLIVQLFMIYFGIPSLVQHMGLSFRFDRFYAAVTALSLYGSAYIAEVLRSGVLSLGKGQWDAARALGLRPSLVWMLVILPQTFRRSIPSLGNEAIGMLKNTSLVSIIGYEELFRKGQLIVADNYQPFDIYVMVAVIYLLITIFASSLNRYIEHKIAI